MHTLICFGDSNTYGYDPRSPLGGRFAPDLRWTGQLTGWAVHEAGQNGRTIPCRPGELAEPSRLAAALEPGGRFLVMLGSNDLLLGRSAPETAARMGAFLRTLPAAVPLLVAPPPLRRGTWVREPGLPDASRQLSRLYEDLAEELAIPFADAGAWGVETLFDGVHFSEAGHRSFAAGLQTALDRL